MIGKFFAVVFCVSVIGFFLFMSPWLWKIPLHNMKLWSFQKSFERIEHMEGSRKIVSHRELNNFGNSNHCDYFVGEFRVSDRPREAIIRHYQGLYIPSPDDSIGVWSGDLPTITAIEVYFLDDDVFRWWPWSEWLGKYASQLPEDRESAYLVFAMEDGYPPIGDFRCH